MEFQTACKAFEKYLDEYDREDDKIRLKILHTYEVVKCAEQIATDMGLSREDVELAKIIGLLHDIGRFEQIRRYDSFQFTTMDHARYGAGLLFGKKGMIRQFLPEDSFDVIIEKAIEKHSDFALEGVEDPRTLLHARLIRDADKLDNCRVKIEESIQTLLGVTEKEAGKGLISPKVWKSCLDRRSVLLSDRVTKVDYWVSYVAQFFDVNFPETCAIILKENYLPQMVHRLTYEEKETTEKMEQLLLNCQLFLEEKLSQKQ